MVAVLMKLIHKNMRFSCLVHWRRKLGDESSQDAKLYLYRRIKSNFGIDPYLKDIKKMFSRAVTAFRLSAQQCA